MPDEVVVAELRAELQTALNGSRELLSLAQRLLAYAEGGIPLSSAEAAGYWEALEVNDSAVAVLGDDTLKTIARELVRSVRSNLSTDWTVKQSVQAKLRVIVKRVLRKYGYRPDKQEKATVTVLEQAELLSETGPVA